MAAAMGGRGRGRGGAGRGLSFNIDSLGIGRADGVPTAIYQPPPLFPPLQYKAIPLEIGDEYNYMLALKQEFRGNALESSHFVKAAVKKRDIERYSDKYKLTQASDEFRPDWTRLPQELKPLKKKKKKVQKAVASSGGSAVSRKRKIADTVPLDAIKDLDKTDEQQSEEEETAAEASETKKKKDAEDEDDDEDEEEEYEDDEAEEENDYVTEYFDNGEGYGDDDDDNVDEGAIY